MVAQISNGKLKLGGLFDSLKVQVDEYSDIIDKFSQLNLNDKKYRINGKANWDVISEAIGGADERAMSYFKTMDDGNGTINNSSASIDGMSAHLNSTGQAFDFAAVKATLLNSALNAGIFFVATMVIQDLSKVIDNYVHAEEIAIERMDKAKSKISELNTAHEQHTKLVEESGDRYIELSNKMGSLTTEELKEFNVLNKQFTEAFPDLITGFNNQGDAIADIGTNAEESRNKLQELLAQEEKTANYEIFKNLNDLYSGTKVKLDAAIDSQKEFDTEISKANEKLKNANEFLEFDDSVSLTLDYKKNGAQIRNNLMDVLAEFQRTLHEDYDDYSLDQELINTVTAIDNGNFDEYTGEQNVWFSLVNWTPAQKSLFKQMLQDDSIEATSLLKNELANVSSELNDEISNLTEDNNKIQQEAESAWKDYTNNLANAMQSQQTFKDIDDTELQDIAIAMVRVLDRTLYEEGQEINYDWIRNNILNGLKNLDENVKFEVKMAYQELLTLNPDDITPKNQLAIENIINTLADLLGKDPIQIRLAFGFDESGIQTKYAETMRKAYLKFGADKYDDKGFATGDTELDNFAKENSIDTKEEVDFWNKCIEESETREDAMKMYLNQNPHEITALNTSEAIEKFKALEDSMSNLDNAYASLSKGEKVDLSTLDGIQKSFAELEDVDMSVIENALEQISNANSLEDAKSAINSLAHEYLNASNIVKELDENNKNLIATELKSIGYKNADASVSEILNNKQKALSIAKQDLIDKQKSYIQHSAENTNATYEQSSAFVEEANMTNLARAELANLVAQQTIFDNDTLDVSDKIAALGSLAAAYMGTAAEASFLNKTQGGLNSNYRISAEVAWKETVAEFAKKIDFGSGPITQQAKDASSSAQNTFSEVIDWIEKRLQKLGDATDRLKAKFEDAFALKNINKQFKKAMNSIQKELTANQKAYDQYMNKANSVAISPDYKNKIKGNTLDIDTITDEGLKDKIDEYQKWYDKAQACKDAIRELRKEEQNLIMQKGDKILEYYDTKNDVFTSRGDNNSAYLDLMDARGVDVTSSKYTDTQDKVIKNAQNTVTNRKNALTKYKNWYNKNKKEMTKDQRLTAQAQIADLRKQVKDAKTAVIEAEDAKYYETQKSAVAQQMAIYAAEKTHLTSLLPTLEEGSDEWLEAKEEIQECDDAIKECQKNPNRNS